MSNRVKGSNSDEWETPPELWTAIDHDVGFTFDLAASASNTKCPRYYSIERSFLELGSSDLHYGDVCWCNPPFSLAKEFFKKIGELKHPVIAIFRCDNMETKAWQEIWKSADWVWILPKRIQYCESGQPLPGCPFPSAVIGFRTAGLIGSGVPKFCVGGTLIKRYSGWYNV